MKKGKQLSMPSLEKVQVMRILTAYKYLKDAAIKETAISQDKMALISNNTKEPQLQNSDGFRKFFVAEKCKSYFKVQNIQYRCTH